MTGPTTSGDTAPGAAVPSPRDTRDLAAPLGPVVGMVGAGQLARMTQQAAIALGVELRVLANARDESAARVVADVRLGDHRDLADLRAFAKGCDVITFDHEHVPDRAHPGAGGERPPGAARRGRARARPGQAGDAASG